MVTRSHKSSLQLFTFVLLLSQICALIGNRKEVSLDCRVPLADLAASQTASHMNFRIKTGPLRGRHVRPPGRKGLQTPVDTEPGSKGTLITLDCFYGPIVLR